MTEKLPPGLLQLLNSQIALGRDYQLSEIDAVEKMKIYRGVDSVYLDLDGEIAVRRRIIFMIENEHVRVERLLLRIGMPGFRPIFDDTSEVHFRLKSND